MNCNSSNSFSGPTALQIVHESIHNETQTIYLCVIHKKFKCIIRLSITCQKNKIIRGCYPRDKERNRINTDQSSKVLKWLRGKTFLWKDLGTTIVKGCKWSPSVFSDYLQPHGLYSPWNSPSQNTGVGSLFLLQGIFPTQGSNPGCLHCGQILYQLSHREAQEKGN